MPRDNGKVFERELLASFKRSGFRAHRISDKMFWSGNRPMSSESEADFWVFGAAESLSAALVEAKAVSARSLPLDRLQEHQRAALVDFDGFHEDAHGFVAVNFYDKDDKRSFNTAFLVPIGTWVRFEETTAALGRKSIPYAAFDDEPSVIKCPRIKGQMYDTDGLKEAML